MSAVQILDAALFLSTPSARRATRGGCRIGHIAGSISIHALREEGDAGGLFLHTGIRISIHALREEGDYSDCFYIASIE